MSIYNEDELQAPKWLDKEFLRDMLRDYENDKELEILNVTITPGSSKGDHFASCMFRAKVEYRKVRDTKLASRSLIVKILPEPETFKGQMLKDSKIFETEISMYTEALPRFEKILAEYGDNTQFGPKVIYTSITPNKVIIFEDLCELGYDALRGRHLEMNELRAVLLKLAKLHAVSYKIGKSDQAVEVTKYKAGLFMTPEVFNYDMMGGGINRFKRLLETNEELRVFLPKFKDIEADVRQSCIDLYTAYENGDQTDIFVLNHGDFHLKNLMFKFDEENRFEDVMLVDYQISVFGPSTIDLAYATYMMFDLEQRLEKRDEIMRFYFESFIATLKQIDFQGKLPTFGEFQIASLKHRRFGIFLLATFLPLTFAMAKKPEDLKEFDPSQVVNDSDALMEAYLNPAFIEELKKLLPELLNKGYID